MKSNHINIIFNLMTLAVYCNQLVGTGGNYDIYLSQVIRRRAGKRRAGSAASIAACGMLKMIKFMDEKEAAVYERYARQLMKSLYERYAVKNPRVSNGLVLQSTYSNHSPYNTCDHCGVDECNAWGDYFYMEAMTGLHKDWNLYW